MIRRWAARVAPAILLFFAWGCGSSTPAPNATPQISGLFPSEITAGSQSFTLFVAGVQFMTGSTVQWNGSDLPTTFNSQSTQVAATVPAADVQNAGIAQVTVTNPTPGGGRSLAISFTINPATNGGPTITSLSPSSAALNAAAFTLTVNGTNFTSSDYVTWNGGLRQTTFVSATQLTAQILASDLTQQMIAGVAVHTAQLGQASPSVSFAVGNPPSAAVRFPELISVSRTGKVADGQSSSPAMSSGGRYVAFYSTAKNLVSGAAGNIFLRDACIGAANCTARTIPVDVAMDGSAPNGPAGNDVAISADGRYVAFTSSATNLTKDRLSGNEGSRVFVRDLCIGAPASAGCTPHTELVSFSSRGDVAGGTALSISADGRFVSFMEAAVSSKASAGAVAVVRDTCHGASARTACTVRTIVASVEDGVDLDANARAAISATGRYVVFASDVHSTRHAQIFLRDTCLGVSASEACVPSTARVSIAPDGQFGDAASGAPAISGDGRFVVFESAASNLADGSGSGRQIFLRDTCLGATAPFGCSPSTTRISGADVADAVGDASSPAISASGRYISYIAKSESSGTASDSGNVGYIVVYDTCFGATGACSPHATELTASDSSGNVSPLTADVRVPVPVTDDGRLASFFTKQGLPVLRGSGFGDVFLTATPFSAQQ